MNVQPFSSRLVVSMKRQKSSPWEQSGSQMSHLVTVNSSGSSETCSKIFQALSQGFLQSFLQGHCKFSCGGGLYGEDKPAVPCQHTGLGAWFAGPVAAIVQAFPAVGGSKLGNGAW